MIRFLHHAFEDSADCWKIYELLILFIDLSSMYLIQNPWLQFSWKLILLLFKRINNSIKKVIKIQSIFQIVTLRPIKNVLALISYFSANQTDGQLVSMKLLLPKLKFQMIASANRCTTWNIPLKCNQLNSYSHPLLC